MERKIFVSYQFNIGTDPVNFGNCAINVHGPISDFSNIVEITGYIQNMVAEKLGLTDAAVVSPCILFWREFEQEV